MSLGEFDALIVTALQLERRAVREHLDGVEVERDTRLAADVGRLSRREGDLTLAVIETGAGNVPAALLAAHGEEIFRPTVVLMVGIAGGLKDVNVGDVVASTKIYWYESGKQLTSLASRPDFAPVGTHLLQSARAVASHDRWRQRVPDPRWVADHPPAALAAPSVVGEKVLGTTNSTTVAEIRIAFGDAVCVNMEDYGALRGAAFMERAQTLAVRGISDLLDGKVEAEEQGSQLTAAANAAGFSMELLATHFPPSAPSGRDGQASQPRKEVIGQSGPPGRALVDVGRELYPEGPQQDSLWERAGGDPSRLPTSGTGQSRWWQGVRLIERGGGPTLMALVAEMLADYPGNGELQGIRSSL